MGDDGSVGRGAASPGAGVDPPRQGAPVTQSLDRSATEAAGLRGGAAGWTAGQTGWAATGDHHPHRHGNQPSLFSRRSEGTDAYLGPAHGGDPHTAGEEPGPLDSSTPEGFFSPGWSNFLHSTENSKHTFLSNQILYGINPSQISANFSANETYMDVSLWINESNYYGNVTAADGATGGGGNGSAGGGGGAGADGAALGLLGDISLGFILGLLCMATFVGNAMVLHAVRTEKRLQTVRTFLPSCSGESRDPRSVPDPKSSFLLRVSHFTSSQENSTAILPSCSLSQGDVGVQLRVTDLESAPLVFQSSCPSSR